MTENGNERYRVECCIENEYWNVWARYPTLEDAEEGSRQCLEMMERQSPSVRIVECKTRRVIQEMH